MDYFIGEPFLQIKFPSLSIKTALIKHESIKSVVEKEVGGKLVVYINLTDGKYWQFDGTMEQFKENCETIRL